MLIIKYFSALNIIPFCHLKLAIASTIPALNEQKIKTSSSAAPLYDYT